MRDLQGGAKKLQQVVKFSTHNISLSPVDIPFSRTAGLVSPSPGRSGLCAIVPDTGDENGSTIRLYSKGTHNHEEIRPIGMRARRLHSPHQPVPILTMPISPALRHGESTPHAEASYLYTNYCTCI